MHNKPLTSEPQSQTGRAERRRLLRQSAIAVLLVLAGYHSAPRSRPVSNPVVAAQALPAAAVEWPAPQAPLDGTPITPAESAGAAGRE